MSTLTANYPYALDLQLPWQEDDVQQQKFVRTLKRILVAALLFFLVMPWLPIVDKDYEEPELDIIKMKIVLEPIILEPEATPEPVVIKRKPKPLQQPLQKENAKPKDAKQIAKEKKKKTIVEAQGLTALSSDLNSLRQSLDLKKFQRKNVSTSQGGKVALANSTVLGEDKLSQRSEGLVVDESMMKTENIALAAHKSTTLDGFIDDGAPLIDSSNYSSDLKSYRSTESIRRVLEAGKSRAYMLYQRELRVQPGLAGIFVFDLVIEPSGIASGLTLVSSELNSPELEQKILQAIQKLEFGVQDVTSRRIRYTFNFLPG